MPLSTLSFGCRLNAAESALMQARAAEAGLDDALLVNTCAVTAEAVRQARQAIRRARRDQPHRRIVVSGCAAQIEPEAFARMPEVDLVLGNNEKLSTDSYRDTPSRFGVATVEKTPVSDVLSLRETASDLAAGFSASDQHRVRAFVQVQNGCDHRCTFCVIPFGRGNSRSVPIGAVVDAIQALVEEGAREIVLTGVDITSYGADLPGQPKLGSLVRQVLKHVPELPRLRLSSIDSIEADAELLRAIADDERLMPHLHLSLQSGDDIILKRMKRRHSRADAIRFCERVRKLRADAVFGADLIAGFPTETDTMFENTLSLVDDCGLTFLHVFPFSPRAETAAARMPLLPQDLVHARAMILRGKGQQALSAFLASEVGKVREILVETAGLGRTEHYVPVSVDTGAAGAIISARIVGFDAKRLSGTEIREAA